MIVRNIRKVGISQFEGTGKIIRRRAVTEACNANGGKYAGGSTVVNFDTLSFGDFGLYAVANPNNINPPKDFTGNSGFRFLIPILDPSMKCDTF